MIRALVLILSLAGGTAAVAQPVNGSLRGYIKDGTGAVLPGVTVTTTTTAAAGMRSVVSDAEGFYRLQNLPPGDYTVTAELEGFAKHVQPGVSVRAELNLELNIVMKVGGPQEVVEVKADVPMLEVSRAVQAVNITGEFQRSVPLTTKHSWDSFLFLAPGVVSTGTQDYLFYVHGANFTSHVLQLDGADVGAVAQGSTVLLSMGDEMLEDIQIKTGGLDASSPIGQGAIMSMVTKSGTNEFKGSFNQVFQSKRWSSNNNPAGTTSAFSYQESAISAGGPLRRDRVWFFGSYKYSQIKQGLSRTPQQVTNLQALVPGWEPFDPVGRVDFIFAKATAQFSTRHQLTAFYTYDRNPRDNASPTHAAVFSRQNAQGTALNARLASVWGSSLTTRVTASFNNRANPGTLVDETKPQRDIYQSTQLSGGVLRGVTALATLDSINSRNEQPIQKATLALDATYYKPNLLGSHELQAGLYLQPRLHNEVGRQWVNGGFTVQSEVLRNPNNPAAGTIPFQRSYTIPDHTRTTNTDTHDYAVYIQDAWRPLPRLTLTPGVRVDVIRRFDNLFDVTAQRSTEVGPRLGVNYLLTRDNRNTIRGSFGRVHDNPSTSFNVSPGTLAFEQQQAYDLDLNGTFETVIVTPAVTRLTLNRIIDVARLHQPHMNEWLIGYRRQLPAQMSVDVSVMRREFRERLGGVDVNVIYDNGVFRGYKDLTQNAITKVVNNTWNWPVYKAFEVQVSRQASNLQVLTSYTRQFQRLAGTWVPGDPGSIIQPGAFANDRGIGGVLGLVASPNSLSGGDQTDNTQWVPHLFRVAAAYRGPFGLLLAASYIVQSGVYSGPIITRVAAADPAFGPATLVLSNGRLVTNPLATTNRFAFENRAAGQLQLPSRATLSLRVGRTFAIGARRIDAAVDVLNALNSDADQSFNFGANQTFSTLYRTATNRVAPRSAQFTFKLLF